MPWPLAAECKMITTTTIQAPDPDLPSFSLAHSSAALLAATSSSSMMVLIAGSSPEGVAVPGEGRNGDVGVCTKLSEKRIRAQAKIFYSSKISELEM